jgi:hypothetical protein
MSWRKINNNPLFIGGHRKCGTTMFASLLDGHEGLFIYPSETGFFYKFYPIFANSKYSDKERENRVVEAILKTLDEVIAEWVGFDACPDYHFEKLVRFFHEKLRSSAGEIKDYFESTIYAAWACLSKNKNSQKYWVEKTTSIELYANTLFEWYPKAKFIHLLRDPRDNYASIKSGWDKRYKLQFDSQERLLQSVIDRARLGMEFAEINQKRFGDHRYKLVRYEDLVSDPERILNQVCTFLDIPFHNSLLIPTFCGVGWKGNNFEAEEFRTVSRVNVNRWRERVEEHEAKVLEFYFRDLMVKYDYPLVFDLQDAADAAREHYKWFNFNQPYSINANKTYSIKHVMP